MEGEWRRSSSLLDCNSQQLVSGWGSLTRLGVARRELLEHIHAAKDLAENRVFAIELGCRSIGDEELAAAGVGSRVDHAHHPRLVKLQIWIDFCDNKITGIAFA